MSIVLSNSFWKISSIIFDSFIFPGKQRRIPLAIEVLLAAILLASVQNELSGQQESSESQQSFLYNISSLAELFDYVEGSVISVDVELPEGISAGSGFVYDNVGHIVTNNHVIEGAKVADVTFIDGTTYSARVVGTDPHADLAVLELEDKSGLALSEQKVRHLELGNSSSVRVGDQVVAIGNPMGLSGSMSYGIVSQVGRHFPEPGAAFSIPDVIQTDADINAGNSGGPLFDFNGEVIGVNSGGLSPGGGGSVGLNFAISSNTVQKVVPELINNGTYKHAWLGIYGRNVGPADQRNFGLEEAKGFMLLQVFDNTPASIAGLQNGDIIIGIDDIEIRKIEDILSYVDSKSVGDTVELEIIRMGSNLTIPIELVERPVPEQIRIIDQPGL